MSTESDPKPTEGEEITQAKEEMLTSLSPDEKTEMEAAGSQLDRAAKEEMALARSQFWAIEGCDEETKAE